jgi:hypothetical protein
LRNPGSLGFYQIVIHLDHGIILAHTDGKGRFQVGSYLN